VLSLCASHHQDGTGNDPTAIAIHPWKARFEKKYGTQKKLMTMCKEIIEKHDIKTQRSGV
jgi:hypothetical protein